MLFCQLTQLKHLNNIAVFSEVKPDSTKIMRIPLLNIVIR